MTSFKNMVRAAALGIAMIATAAVPTKQAYAADRSDVIAGVAGGLLLGTFFAAAANASNRSYAAPVQTYQTPTQSYVAPQQIYQAPVQTQIYTAPVQTYSAPVSNYYAPVQGYYSPPVSLSFGISRGHRFGHRRHFNRHHGHKYSHSRHHRGHRGYRY